MSEKFPNITYPNDEKVSEIIPNISKEKFNPLIFEISEEKTNFTSIEPIIKINPVDNNIENKIIDNTLNINKISLNNNTYNIFSNPNIVGINALRNVLELNPTQLIGAENIAEFVLPLVEYIQQAQPDYIVACDRGARLIGMAVHMLYRELYGSLPTRDQLLHFKRVSKSNNKDQTDSYLAPFITDITSQVEAPKVFVLDDWITGGTTKEIVEESFNRHSGNKAQITFGVLKGDGADVTGTKNILTAVDWHDRTDKMGVDYHKGNFLADVVHRKSAIEYRQRMSTHIKQFAEKLRQQRALE